MDDKEAKPEANPGCRMGKSLSDENLSSEPKNASTSASFVINEEDTKTYSFKAYGEGTSKSPDEMKDAGDTDNTTGTNYLNWQPVDTTYHKHEQDKHAVCGCLMNNISCYKWNGPLSENGVVWGNGCKGWEVNRQFFVYHFDSPTFYGLLGQIGENDYNENKETGPPNDPQATYNFTYFVPSVPIWYSISSGLSFTWDWKGQWQHGWKVTHGADAYKNQGKCKPKGSIKKRDGLCDVCGHPVKEIETWTDPKNPDKDTTNWDPGRVYTEIQTPKVATDRQGKPETGFDNEGIASQVYSDKQSFDLPDKPAVIARATVRVKDIRNVAHVQTGLKSGNMKIMQTECGKKYSEPVDEEITIRFLDNAPHATQSTIGNEGGERCVSIDGDWEDKQFQAIFWYESPLYQYTSYHADTWTNQVGKENKVTEILYSPMFVWKKGKVWNSLYKFLTDRNSTSDNTKVYGNGGFGECPEKGRPNPRVIVYEKTFKASYLMKSQDASEIEMAPWHYARTSLGDAFGNPPYDEKAVNDLFGKFEYTDSKGRQVAFPGAEIKFKYQPINFSKGKGPLKYFVEVRDGSRLTKGGGKEEQNFDCAGRHFVENTYTQGQIYFNPKKVKYICKSSDADELNPPGPYDPTSVPSDEKFCLSDNYPDDPLQTGWKECKGVKPVLFNNGDGDAKILDHFQTWGMIDVVDKIRPNVGLRIVDTVKGTIRRVYRLNDNRTLKCYGELMTNPGSNWAVLDQNEKFNYILPKYSTKPRPPFSLNGDSQNDRIWVFNELGGLLSSNADGKIWEGKPSLDDNDSMMPYGTSEDTKLEVSHQDLRDSAGRADFVPYYANDNIDGQRVMSTGQQALFNNAPADKYWYKGVSAFDFNVNELSVTSGTKAPAYPDHYINKGLTSWQIKDETYPNYDSNPVFEKMYKNGDYFIYPHLTFNNPNCKWTGEDLNGKKEISVAYGVRDREGNVRKFKLFFYVAPLDMKINTLENKQQRTE